MAASFNLDPIVARPIPALLFAALFYNFLKIALALYRFITGPNKIAHLPGPGVRHWFYGSWDHFPTTRGTQTIRTQELVNQYGRVVGITEVGRQPTVLLADPLALSSILGDTESFGKAPRTVAMVKRFMGTGFIGAEGDQHRRQRKVAAPAFSSEATRPMFDPIFNVAEQLVRKLQSQMPSPTDEVTNIAPYWTKFSMDTLGRAGFNYEFGALNSSTSQLESAVNNIMKHIGSKSRFAILRYNFAFVEPLARVLRIREQVELDAIRDIIKGISQDLIKLAKERAPDGSQSAKSDVDKMQGRDVLSLMTRASTDPALKPNQRLSEEELNSMVLIMLFAGQETSAAALSWTCYALTKGVRGLEVQARLRAELLENQAAWKSGMDGLNQLPYLNAVVREVLRLHTPVRHVYRLAKKDTWVPLHLPVEIEGALVKQAFVPKGALALCQIRHINIDDEVWGDGSAFRPERWLPETHPYFDPQAPPAPRLVAGGWSSLATFGSGPANCIGQKLAVFEIKVGLAVFFSSLELLPPTEDEASAPEISTMDAMVTRPVLVGQERKGANVPVRIRRLVDAL